MNSNTLTLEGEYIPEILRTIPSPPKKLFYQGPLLELLGAPRLSVVGSRKVTPYGKYVTSKLAGVTHPDEIRPTLARSGRRPSHHSVQRPFRGRARRQQVPRPQAK